MKKILLSEAQYQDLLEGKLYINIYDMSFMTLCELNRYWKELFFDILDKLQLKNLVMIKQENLLTFMKNNYKIIIEENHLDIDFRDYVEINDYVSLSEWLEYTNHFIEKNNIGVFLLLVKD